MIKARDLPLAVQKQIAKDNPIVAPAKKGAKYKNQMAEADGIKFHSMKERDIYLEFKMDPHVEIISKQPQFDITQKLTRTWHKFDADSARSTTQLIKPITYRADFKVRTGAWNTLLGLKNEFHEFVVEVKSEYLWKNDRKYILKRNLFLATYPQLVFWEIIFNRNSRTDYFYTGGM